MPLRKTVISDFGPEIEIPPLLRMPNEKMVKTQKMYSVDKISLTFRKYESPN